MQKIIIILTTAIIFSLGLACSGDSGGDTPADTTAKWGSAKWGEGKWNP